MSILNQLIICSKYDINQTIFETLHDIYNLNYWYLKLEKNSSLTTLSIISCNIRVWLRNLVAEGIEPNPGPVTWQDFLEACKEKWKEDFPSIKEFLDDNKEKWKGGPLKVPLFEKFVQVLPTLGLDTESLSNFKSIIDSLAQKDKPTITEVLLSHLEESIQDKLLNDKNDEGAMEYTQRSKLNGYFKKLLPTLPNSFVPDLRLLHRTTVPNSDMDSLCKKIAETHDSKSFHVASFIGPPGCGKTTAIFHIAQSKFVTFFDCQDAPLGKDSNYRSMQSNTTAIFYNYGEQEQHKHRRSELTQDRILLEYCARRMHLALLLAKFPDLTPKEYLQIQLKSGVEAIGEIVTYLKRLDPKFIRDFLKNYNEKIFATRYGKEEIIAIDEAGAAAVVLKDKIISLSALNSGELDKAKGNKKIPIDEKHYRGLLGALNSTFCSIAGATLILASPELGLREYDVLGTTLGKEKPKFIVDFERLSRDYIIDFFEEYFNLSRDTLEKAFGKEWDGSRPRYIEIIINQLYDPNYISAIKVNGNTLQEKFVGLVKSVEDYICKEELGVPLSNAITKDLDKTKALHVIYKTMSVFAKDDHYFYPPADQDAHGDIKRLFCYITVKSNSFAYDRLDPFAFKAVAYVMEKMQGKLGESRRIRVLSLDGGGIRGLMEACILAAIERKTGKPIRELFDVICGTSTGGILALATTFAKLSGDECIEMYKTFGKIVFGSSFWRPAFEKSIDWITAAATYAANMPSFEMLLKEYFKDMTMDSLDSNNNNNNNRMSTTPKVFTLASKRGTVIEPYLIRSYTNPFDTSLDVAFPHNTLVTKAARATSAAPTYFPSCKILNRDSSVECVDGGIVANNPIHYAYVEACSMFPHNEIICIVSIGTGLYNKPNATIPPLKSLKDVLKDVTNAATESENTHRLFQEAIVSKNYLPGVYFRFNPPLESEIELDDYSIGSIGKMVGAVNAYMTTKKFEEDLNKINNLINVL